MLVRSQVKYIQNLGHKKFRDADGVFVAEGPKIVNELLYSDRLQLRQCFATEGWMNSHDEIVKVKKELFFKTDEKELERISFHSTPNQVLAVFTKPVFNQMKEPAGITLLLETIQDPGNLGTIIRTADWFGIKQIICSMDTVDVFNPKVVQSAMGSIIRVEMIYTDLKEYIRANQEIPLYASSLEGEDIYQSLSLSNALLLMGNESRGISQSLESLAAKKIRIPRLGGAESLNVAVATGILLSRIRQIS
jgi:RNA methyltransferase, TrmH family